MRAERAYFARADQADADLFLLNHHRCLSSWPRESYNPDPPSARRAGLLRGDVEKDPFSRGRGDAPPDLKTNPPYPPLTGVKRE